MPYFMESWGFQKEKKDKMTSSPVDWSISVGQPDQAKEDFNLVDLILELSFSLGQTQDLEQVIASISCRIIVSRLPFSALCGACCETVSSCTMWPGITFSPDSTGFRLDRTS